MAMKWPSVKVLQHDIRNDPGSTQVSVKCEMHCGKPMEVSGSCKKTDDSRYKQQLKNDINQRAAHHVRNCDTCKPYYLKSK
jgi:hypothetical protein